jgi:hypothetical protein
MAISHTPQESWLDQAWVVEVHSAHVIFFRWYGSLAREQYQYGKKNNYIGFYKIQPKGDKLEVFFIF